MKIWKIVKDKTVDTLYSLAPKIMKVLGPVYVWTRKLLANMVWVGIVAIPIELVCRQWSMVWCTLAAMAASVAAAEAVRMRKAFKAWGFGENGPTG